LIKEFEGCELTAYVCPAGVLTIGYGSTGGHVTPGKTITEAEAEALLLKDLTRFEKAVNELVKVPMTQGAYDALVSFTFNCGEGAFGESTLLRKLNAGEDPNSTAKTELPRWTNGGLAGLVRRRAAEVELFCSGGAAAPAATGGSTSVDIKAMQATLLKKKPVAGTELADNEKVAVEPGKAYAGCKVLKEEAGHKLLELPGGSGQWWVYMPHWAYVGDAPKAAAAPAATASGGKVLNVKYQSQRDNRASGNDLNYRTCFSSSCAMLAMTVKPGCVAGDDAYIQKRQPFGDSTDGGAQVACLKSLGINARFTQSGNNDTIKKQIDRGIPVPVGILHHGPASAPSGGGHWICVIGYDDSGFVVHDPWGEIDNASGTYVSENGASKHYSYKLFDSRWTVAGNSDGWAVLVD
jgi:GH24 family phage-related lysozyme (muramidase)